MSVEPEYDVAIVGARVAGSSLAILLARQGHRVVVVDREAFPSDTLSTHFVQPMVVQNLERLGVLDGLLEAGFRRLTRHRTYVEDCVLEGPSAPQGGFSLAPRRNVLDSLLQERAVAEGATLLTRTSAEGLVMRDGVVAGILADGREVLARAVIGADGKTSKVAEWVGTETYREVEPQRPVYYGYFNGVSPLPEPSLEIFFGGGTIGFIFPMRPGEDCLALELQPEDFEAFRGDTEAAFRARFSQLHGMEARLHGATVEGKLKGSKGVANYLRVPYGPGWALVGDAGYLKDPATGLGIGDAVTQAFMLAESLETWLGGAAWDETMKAFHERRDATFLPSYESTLEMVGMTDLPADEIDVLRALLAAPTNARVLGQALPAGLEAVLPAARAQMTRQYAAMFTAARARAAAQ